MAPIWSCRRHRHPAWVAVAVLLGGCETVLGVEGLRVAQEEQSKAVQAIEGRVADLEAKQVGMELRVGVVEARQRTVETDVALWIDRLKAGTGVMVARTPVGRPAAARPRDMIDRPVFVGGGPSPVTVFRNDTRHVALVHALRGPSREEAPEVWLKAARTGDAEAVPISEAALPQSGLEMVVACGDELLATSPQDTLLFTSVKFLDPCDAAQTASR